MWILGFLSSGPYEVQEKIIKTGCIAKILEHIMINKKEIQLPCIRIIGNLSSHSDLVIEKLIHEDVINTLIEILEHNHNTRTLMDDIIWCFKNFSDSNVKIINYILNIEKVSKTLIFILEKINDFRVIYN